MNSIADRIVIRMKEHGLSQADLMRATGAGRATVSGWINGPNAPSAKYLGKLAETLKSDSTWLLTGGELGVVFESNLDLSHPTSVIYAPVLSWVQAGSFTDMESINYTDLEYCERLPLVPGAGKRSFYLKVRGVSNAPEFEEGERICIDPDCSLCDIQTGEMVVVSCNGEATFKALIVEPNGYYLKPLNPDWHEQIIKLPEGSRLVGRYVGSFRPAKRFF